MGLSPGGTIGILGGGQLGRMLALAAARLGLKTVIYDPDPEAPSAQVANRHICAAYDNRDGLLELRDRCDVVTYEFENIPLETARFFEEIGMLRPGALALEKSQDRLAEKEFIRSLSVGTAAFHSVGNLDELVEAVSLNGGAGILKTRRFGYDGKGQARLMGDEDPDALASLWREFGGKPAILEGFVEFEREISVIAARTSEGTVACFDPAENVHRNGILHTSTVPAGIARETHETAMEIARAIVTALDYIGVIGIEFFVLKDGGLLVNEMAPRVHNSGHWTEAACTVSQFEQHIRAVAGWPLGNTGRHSDCRMTNLIGDEVNDWASLLRQNQTLLHLYGKSEVRTGRKMGHFTQLF